MRSSRRTRWLLLAMCVLAPAATARAQDPDAPSLRRHHVNLNGGLLWAGGYDIGDAAALLRGNAPGASAPPFTLFRSESSVESVAGAEARVGYAVAPGWSVDLGVAFSRPRISVRLSQDPETAPAELDAERLFQYTVDVGVVWQIPRLLKARRLRPFVTAGIGYLRQLYDERTLVETGRIYYAGSGARVWLRGGDGRRRSLGLRGDLRATWRQDGVEFEDATRVWPSASVLLFWEP